MSTETTKPDTQVEEFNPEAFIDTFESEEVQRAKDLNLSNPEGSNFEPAPTLKKTEEPEKKPKEETEDPVDETNYDELEDWDEKKPEAKELTDEEKATQLASINAALGTKFETLEEAKGLVKKDEPAEKTTDKPAESKMLLEENDQKILGSLNEMLKLDASELMKVKLRENFISGVKNGIISEGFTRREDGAIIPDEEEITFKLEELKGDWTKFQSEYEQFSNQLKNAVGQLNDKNAKLNGAYQSEKNEGLKESRKVLQSELKNMTTFMGVEVDGQTRHKVYNEIVSGKFFEEIVKTDKDVAEMALLRELFRNGNLKDKLISQGIITGKETVFSDVHEHKPKSASSSISNPSNPDAGSGFKPDGWNDFGYKK